MNISKVFREEVLLEVLRNYPKAKRIEDKSSPAVKDKESIPSSLLQKLLTGATQAFEITKDALETTKDTLSEQAGFNSFQRSEAGYKTLINYVHELYKKNDPTLVPEILWYGGLVAHITRTTSLKTSGLSDCVLAFRALMVRNIYKKMHSKDQETAETAKFMYTQIQKWANKCIDSMKNLVRSEEDVEALHLSLALTNGEVLNKNILNNFKASITNVIELIWLKLYFLGNNLPTNFELTRPKELFKGYSFYSSKFKVDAISDKNIKRYLPIDIQPVFIAIYLREKYPDLQKIASDESVIDSFEFIVQSKIESKQKGEEEMRKLYAESADPEAPPSPEAKDIDNGILRTDNLDSFSQNQDKTPLSTEVSEPISSTPVITPVSFIKRSLSFPPKTQTPSSPSTSPSKSHASPKEGAQQFSEFPATYTPPSPHQLFTSSPKSGSPKQEEHSLKKIHRA